MRRLALFDSVAALLLLAAAASPFLHSNSGAHAATLSALREVTPDSNGVTSLTLTVDAARHVVDGAVTFTSRAYYYQGTAALQGPLIVLRPGGKLNLTLINNLQDDSALDATRPMNTFRHANTTNVHTHGLHVDPAIDSVFRHAAPAGGTLLYDMPIPADHAPGMHWYHSHTHGAATMHIMGGLVGAMYVEWQTRDNIPAAISSLTRHRLIMQFLSFETETRDGVVTQSCNGGLAGFNPFKTYSFAELESESGSTLASSPTYASTDRTFYLINGQFRPSINVAPGESRLIQLVYAAGAKNPALIIPSTCTASHIAFDGVYFDTPRTVTFIQLIVASRVEFVLTCASAGTHSVNVINNGNIDNVRTTGGTVLFSVVAAGTTVTSATVPTTLGITRPSYLVDMQSLTSIDTRNQVSVAQGGSEACKFWIGMGSDCTTVAGPAPRRQTTSTCRFASFTGAKGLTASAHDFVMTVGQTSEWKLIGGGNAPHPLHIHVNHYQVVSYSGSSTVMNHWMRAGEWRDTIPLLDGTITVRFKADTLSGETVVHCHELNHEDKGLMSSFLILPATTSTSTSTSTNSNATSTSTATTVTTPPSPTGTDGNVLPPSFSTQSGNSAVYATPFAWFAGFLAMLAAL